MPFALIAMVPPVLLALLAQRYLVRGPTLGAVKRLPDSGQHRPVWTWRPEPAIVPPRTRSGVERAVPGLWTNSLYTLLMSWLKGELVGEDQYGNRYYRERRRDEDWRRPKRWVVFAREAEPTEIPPGWVGWLHKRIKEPPTEQPLPAPRWEKERLPNPTGTTGAFMPSGAIERGGHRPPATGDYEAWRPE